jgi:hypothetical protein
MAPRDFYLFGPIIEALGGKIVRADNEDSTGFSLPGCDAVQ